MEIAYAADTAMKVDTGISHALLSAGPVVQLTLLILIVLSIGSWAIAWSKHKRIKQARQADYLFLNRFFKAPSFESVSKELHQYQGSVCARIFEAGYSELQKIAESPLMNKEGENPEIESGLDNIERILRYAIQKETASLSSRLTWLATTGSTGPFIGLFGTVWGIMNSFQKIGITGSASLAVVAPGISEALIATAIGLGAAIPAVMLYNYLNSQIEEIELDMTNFATDFTNVVKRNFIRRN
jgi:biopolymer transport protein TolQ